MNTNSSSVAQSPPSPAQSPSMDPAPAPVSIAPMPPPLPSPTHLKALVILSRIRAHPNTSAMITKLYASRKLFPPRLNVNKFVIGAVVEEYFTRHIVECGFACVNTAANTTVTDICVDGEHSYSIKSCAAIGRDVILENYRGQKKDIPTFPPTFLIALDETVGTTIMYLDDQIVNNAVYAKERYRHSDSNLTLRGSFIRHLHKTLADEYKVVVPYVASSAAEVNIASILCDYIDTHS